MGLARQRTPLDCFDYSPRRMMMAQERRQRDRSPRDRSTHERAMPRGSDTAAVTQIDDLLDEIDSVLEENAEEFVKNYVQKGGE